MTSSDPGLSGASTPPRRLRSRWAAPLVGWTAIALVLTVVQYLARRLQPRKSPALLAGWSQFDGPEYLSIVAEGYRIRQLVWFPAYPLIVSAVGVVARSPLHAAVAVSAGAGLLGAVLFWRWTAVSGLDPSARLVALAVMLVYPYGWFLYGAVYPDALFAAAALAAFLLLERGHLWASALAGALATATRPSGFAVAIGLWVLWMERSGVLRVPDRPDSWASKLRLPISLDRDRLTARSFVPLASLAGLIAYMAYQWAVWGSPARFVTEQANYHEGASSSLLKEQYFDAWYLGFDGRHLATTTAQAVLLMLVLGSVPAVGRRFGWGYGAYVLGLALLPMVSVSTFMGVGRYLLPAFPCFALAGAWLAPRRWATVSWLCLSSIALVVMTAGFARSWYLT